MSQDCAGDFGDHLAALFAMAGSPTLASACAGVNRGRRSRSITPQRLSDWRRGRHLPKDFESVAPVLVWLLDRVARTSSDTPEPAPTGSTPRTLPGWERLWHGLVDTDPTDDADTTGPGQATNPFPGLAPYTDTDIERFFGRDDLIAELIEAITAADRDRIASARPAIVVVTGVSGAGKSSLLAAGLTSSSDVVIGRRLRPSDVVASISSENSDLAADQQATVPIRVVCIDQFEEIFSRSAADQAAYVREVVRIALSVVVVIGVRADLFERCVAFGDLARAWKERCVIVGEMSDVALRDVITRSARSAGVGVESGLPDLVIADVHQAMTDGSRAGRLPLLSHVLRGTWNRRAGGRLTVAAYRGTGGVGKAVADTAEDAWTELDDALRIDARALLLSLVHVGPSGLCLRIPVDIDSLRERFGQAADPVIDVFTSQRLLTVDGSRVEFIHDTVLTAWPRLRTWIDSDGAAQAARQRLEQAAVTWVANDRDRTFLYSGNRLALERRDFGDLTRGLSAAGLAFLRAADNAHRMRRRRWLTVAATVVVLAVTSTVTASVVMVQKGTLASERDETGYRSLLAVIDSLQITDPPLAQQFLLAAHRVHPHDAVVDSMLLATDSDAVPQKLAGHAGAIYGVAYNRSGTLLASAGDDGTARLWDTSGARARSVATLGGQSGYLTSVVFDPAAPVLAVAARDGTVVLWDVRSPDHPSRIGAPLSNGPGPVYTLAFSPDGRTLAAPVDDGRVILWDVADTAHPTVRGTPLLGHVGAARTVAFSPDGRLLASGGDDRTVRLWDVSRPVAVPVGVPFGGFSTRTHSVAFRPSGAVLAVAADSGAVAMFDVSTPSRPRRIGDADLPTGAGSWSVAFDPRSDELAAAGADGNVPLWNIVDVGAPVPMVPLRTGPSGSDKVYSIAYTPDGSHLAAAGGDGTIRLWQLPTTVHAAHAGQVESMALSADGNMLATSGADGRLRLWHDIGDDLAPVGAAQVSPPGGTYADVALSADGAQAATAEDSELGVALWNTTGPGGPRQVGSVPSRARYVRKVSYARDRHLLAVTADDQAVALWDTTDPARPHRVGPTMATSDVISDLTLDPTGRFVAVSSEDLRVRVFDATRADARPVSDVQVGPASALGLSFGADGHELVAADGGVRLWHVSDDGVLRPDATIGGSIGDALSAAVDPTAPRLAVGSADRLQVFDVGDPRHPVADGASVVPARQSGEASDGSGQWTTVFTPTGRMIASGGMDGTLRVLDLDLPATVARLCRTVSSSPMTADVWDRYLEGVPFVAPC